MYIYIIYIYIYSTNIDIFDIYICVFLRKIGNNPFECGEGYIHQNGEREVSTINVDVMAGGGYNHRHPA